MLGKKKTNKKNPKKNPKIQLKCRMGKMPEGKSSSSIQMGSSNRERNS